MTEQREMTLDEWCQRLPPFHAVNKELAELRARLAQPELIEQESGPTYCPTCDAEDGGTSCGAERCGLIYGEDKPSVQPQPDPDECLGPLDSTRVLSKEEAAQIDAAAAAHRPIHETDLYSFAGWLTTRPGLMQVGSSYEAGPMAEAVGEYIRTYPEWFAKSEQAAPAKADRTANPDEVICPKCCTQFRAIPQNVQRLMLDAGFDPPFTAAPPAPDGTDWNRVEALRESLSEHMQIIKGLRDSHERLVEALEQIASRDGLVYVAQLARDTLAAAKGVK